MKVKCDSCKHLKKEGLFCKKLDIRFENGFAMLNYSRDCGE